MYPPFVSPALDVKHVLDHARLRALHYQVFGLCALCMVMDGFDVQSLGYVAPAIIQDWHIAPSLLGPVFGASNLGVLVGQLTFTVLADRIGRRPVLIVGTVLFGLLTVMTGFATSVSQLLVMRLAGGAALGSIIPNATALVAEFTPATHRVTLVTYTGIGFTAGAAVGGLIAAWLIPAFSWRSVLYVGGVVPLMTAVAMIAWLPESLQLLVARRRRLDIVRQWLRRIDPQAPVGDSTPLILREENRAGLSVVHLLRDRRAVVTVLLWIVNFMNLFTVYSLANWLPTVMRTSGYTTSTAVLVGTTLQVGGIVAPLLMAKGVARTGFIPVLAATFAMASIAVASIGQPGLSLVTLGLAVFISGACVVGAQPILNALAAEYYPTYLRSTGLGWSLGIGRAGSIVGPVLAGELLALHWTTREIFLTLAVPMLINLAVALLLGIALRTRSTSARSPDGLPLRAP